MLRSLVNRVRVSMPLQRLEPCAPVLRTAFPGPELRRLQAEAESSELILRPEQGIGNYVADPDGNYLLDMTCAKQNLGYNHDAFDYFWVVRKFLPARKELGLLPEPLRPEDVKRTLLSWAPAGHRDVTVVGEGCVMQAMTKAVVERFQAKHQTECALLRLSSDFSYPTTGPASEAHCLAQLKEKLSTGKVAGVLVAPLTPDCKQASASFYLSVQSLCNSADAAFIVDERMTGFAASGLPWAHLFWGPRAAPDMTLFAANGLKGWYSRKDFLPTAELAVPTDLLQAFRHSLRIIHSRRLIKNSEFMGQYLKTSLQTLQKEGLVTAVRGQGLLVAFDVPCAASLQHRLLSLGVKVETLGKQTIRLRPALILSTAQASCFLHTLRTALTLPTKH